jgi:hypothetical protein
MRIFMCAIDNVSSGEKIEIVAISVFPRDHAFCVFDMDNRSMTTASFPGLNLFIDSISLFGTYHLQTI